MNLENEKIDKVDRQHLQAKLSPAKLKFGEDRTFQTTLRKRVDDFFRESGRKQRDNWQMILKTIIILLAFAVTYVMLVFFVYNGWVGLVLSIVLGIIMTGIGFNIQHDAGHGAYSANATINKIMAKTMDLIGASSWVWHFKHAVIHHTYVNITGWDTDLDLGILARMSPHQKHMPFHKWQQFYMWPLYGFLVIKWQLFDDFQYIVSGKIGQHHIPRPQGTKLAGFIVYKVLFYMLAFVIPFLRHPFHVVLFYYCVTVLVMGILISIVFILPHCSGHTQFPLPIPGTSRMETSWAEHQARVALDFAQNNPVATWCLGGLNFHREHHLFPTICHVNYPAMAPIVKQTCLEFNIPYTTHGTFIAGLVSHYKWLKQMGKEAT